jgi:hypothetical protein
MGDTSTTMSMSEFLSTDDSTETDTTGDSDANDAVFGPNETTDTYYGVGNARSPVGDAAEARYGEDALESSPDEDASAQVRYWAALNKAKNRLGQRQADKNPFALSATNEDGNTYPQVHGELPTVETDTLTAGERDALDQAGLDPDDYGVGGEGCQIPVVNGERLPVVVSDVDDDLMGGNKAIKMVGELLDDEPGLYEGGSTDDQAGGSESDEETTDGETCPHCGDTFDPRGFGPHKAACEGESESTDGDTDETETGETDGNDGENDERAAYVADLIKAGATPDEAEAAAEARYDG